MALPTTWTAPAGQEQSVNTELPTTKINAILGDLALLYARMAGNRTAIDSGDTPYAIAAGQHVDADAASGAITVNLPDAATAGSGALVQVRRINSGANAVTLDGDGADTINGAATLALNSQWDCYTLMSDGVSAWGKV
jgi:hypothetical protein